jgi:capsular polysaccharide biosynthesis protein
MAHHDDEHSAVPNQPPVAIGGSVPGDALVPGGSRLAGQAAQQNAYASPAAQGPDVLKGGMDHSWFLHSLRRRWLLALGMGLVFGGVATAVLWFMFPESSSAVALFRVSSEEPNLVFRGVANETRQFDILQKTQLALLKSHFVLQAAVRDPSIANLGALAGEDDPIQWLSQRVSVNFPQESEILSISLSGDEHSEDLRLIVDAVANAYQEQVIFADRNRKLSTRDVLRKSLAKLNDEIRRKMEDFQELAKEIGSPDLESSDAESRLLLSEISRQLGEFAALRNAAMELQAEFEIAQLHLKDPMLLEAQIDEMLTADPTVGMLQQQAMYLEFQLQDLQSRSRRGSKSEARIQKQLQGLQQQIAQHRQKQKQQMLNSQQSAPNLALRQATDDFRVRASMIRNRIGQLQQEMAVKREQLTALGEQSVDLAVRKSELDYLKEIGNDVA